MKLSVSNTQRYVITFIAVVIATLSWQWIIDNSGLGVNHSGEQIWFARTFAKVCVLAILSGIYIVIGLYAAHRWNLFRGKGAG